MIKRDIIHLSMKIPLRPVNVMSSKQLISLKCTPINQSVNQRNVQMSKREYLYTLFCNN